MVVTDVVSTDVVAVEEAVFIDDPVGSTPLMVVVKRVVTVAVVVVVAVPVVVLVVVVEVVVVTSLVVVVNRCASPVDGQHRICSGQHGVPSNCPMQAVVPAKNGAVQ